MDLKEFTKDIAEVESVRLNQYRINSPTKKTKEINKISIAATSELLVEDGTIVKTK